MIRAVQVREEYVPDVDESESGDKFRVVTLEALVRIKLTSSRRKDQMHRLDMIRVELIDQSCCERFPGKFAGRLQALPDDPAG